MTLRDAEFCPAEIVESLQRYIQQKIPPGGFLQAVLCNDLASAVARADSTNLFFIPAIVAYVQLNVPSVARGSLDAYDNWLRRRPK